MVTRVPVAPDVIRWAREKCGLTPEQAAEKLNARIENLNKIENGNLLPSVTMFREMARIYALPEATLLADEPLELPDLPTDHRTFDGITAVLSYETIIAIRRVRDRQNSLVELAELDNTVTAPVLPLHRLNENPRRLGEAERQRIGIPIADQLRIEPEKALLSWRVLLEGFGISVYVENYPLDDARGISLYDNAFPAIILNQNEKQPGAKLFTLLHEYAHLLVRNVGISDFNPRNGIERFCNQFAAAFLMPDEALRRVFDFSSVGRIDPPLNQLADAAYELCVSISALALRLEEMDYVGAGYYARIVSALARPTTAPRAPAQIPQKYLILSHMGHCYTDAVLKSVDHGHISRVEASRLLRTSTAYFDPLRETIAARRASVTLVDATRG